MQDGARNGRNVTSIFTMFLLLLTVLSVVLFALCFHYRKPLDYAALGELLLVTVIAVEGLVAISELTSNERSARTSANAAVFNLHQTYMSIDYHEKVRNPAWYSLLKASQDAAYRERLLAALAGAVGGEEAMHRQERLMGEQATPEDKEAQLFSYAYHRVVDILRFYTTASLLLLEADSDIVRSCTFSYDSWRIPLYTVVRDLKTYIASHPEEGRGKDLNEDRCRVFEQTLQSLDKLFKMPTLDLRSDPRFRGSDIL